MDADEPARLPLGMYPGRLDDKGRLKLPPRYRDYFDRTGSTRIFVTSLDRRTAGIYPIEAWQEVEARLATAESRIASILSFTAHLLGAETEIDSQGRLQFPRELREALQIENATVHMHSGRSHIKVLSEAVYQEMRQERPEAGELLKRLMKDGLV